MPLKINPETKKTVISLCLIIIFVSAISLFCWIMQYSMLIPLLLLFLGIHLNFNRKSSLRLLLNLGLLIALIIFLTHVIINYSFMAHYYIPVAAIAMLTMLLFNDLQLAFLMAFVCSILVSLVVGGDFSMMLTFFMGGLMGAYGVNGARTRGKLISTGLFVSAIHILCLFLIYWNTDLIRSVEFEINYLWPLTINGFACAFLVAATLKIFESLFGVLTNYSLLELSDFNQPLLKRMILEAPGTYHHSLVVSNLAEAAADAIGANALLTRVGAYYHDIGKMVNSEYFTENQFFGGNKHDKIEPSISRLVIQNHVKEGIELAKKYKLNPIIVDFIPQHHGTSLMYYFYQKAVEEADEGEVINEGDFRYPGPKPQMRETAITLLADSVEGATRALDEQNPNSIEDTVKKVINNKFIDGQLDECNLTLKEIEKITSTFIRILSAMYHGRVKYPEKKDGSEPRKSSEKNSSKNKPDQNPRKENS